jgi:ribonuclease HI
MSSNRWRLWCTAYTDASWHQDTGGWATWLRYNDDANPKRVVRNGPCPDYVKDSTSAELYAICAAIALCLETWDDLEGIGVRSDCKPAITWAIQALSGKTHHKRADIRYMKEKLYKLVREKRIHVVVKWVPAHQNDTSVRTYLNNACDGIAKKARYSAKQA